VRSDGAEPDDHVHARSSFPSTATRSCSNGLPIDGGNGADGPILLSGSEPRESVGGDQILNPLRPVSSRKSPGTSSKVQGEGRPPRVLVVGAGTRFLSGMSHYTIQLTNALAGRFAVAFIPMRQLIPTFLYPGRSRVGSITTRLEYDPAVKVLDGIDWYWVPNLFRDLVSLRKWKPDVVIFEWWTGTVLHTYLAIALLARLLGASIIVEFHEVLDSGEERIPIARAWVSILGRPFIRLASAFVIHSEADRGPLEKRYRLGARPCVVIPLGPHDHHASSQPSDVSAPLARRTPPPIRSIFCSSASFVPTKDSRISSKHSSYSTTTR
jgi:hypothetical protein